VTNVKICGFLHSTDALIAAEAGADAIGLVFVPSARRRLTVEQAALVLGEFRAELGSDKKPRLYGLFADQPFEEVNGIALQLGLDAVQLCGAEGMAYCKEIRVPVSKVIAVDSSLPRAAILPMLMTVMQRHTLAGHQLVLDTFVKGLFGGTGQSFDWYLASELARAFQFSLAGGLQPENVEEAVKLVRPWGVDTSSGVEVEGKKDPYRIRNFVESVRRADKATIKTGIRRVLGRFHS